jgi:hypothetical protein
LASSGKQNPFAFRFRANLGACDSIQIVLP